VRAPNHKEERPPTMERPWLAHYEEGVPAEVEVPDHPVIQDLVRNAAAYPDQPALLYGSVVEPLGNALLDRKMSCGQLRRAPQV